MPGEPASDRVPHAVGCEKCAMTGYRGRRGIFELLQVTEPIESMIINRRPAGEVKLKAIEQGMLTLRQDGWTKVFQGMTTVEEIFRVTEEND
jgi:type II secretory ATPase GspE/PulE/Tfp pilus assembly ATPase PilB-like protein